MNAPELVATIVVLLLLAMGIIVFFVLYQRRILRHREQLRRFEDQKKLELLQASLESQEAVRTTIATELHDDVGATLSSIRLFLTQAEKTPADPKLIAYSKSLLDESIQKVRSLSHQLQPRTIHYLGLLKSLHSLTDVLSQSGTIGATYAQEGEDWPEPEPDVSLAVYRIVQEWVANIIKHAGATHIEVRAHFHNTAPCVGIFHDGEGFSEARYQEELYKKDAIGLKNIEMRIKAAGLTLLFPEPGEPARFLRICLPALSS